MKLMVRKNSIIKNNIEILFLLLSFPLLIIPSIPPFRDIQSVSTWIKGYYYINYLDLGFIKRGFIGSLFKVLRLSDITNPSLLVIFSHLIIASIVGLLFWKYAKEAFSEWKRKDKYIFYVLFTLSPVLFIRLGYDTGRMDLWCLMITLITLFLLQLKDFDYLNSAIILSFSITIQLLIHEASLLFYIPLMSCLYIYKFPNNFAFYLKNVFPVFSIPLICSIMLLIFGRYDASQEELNLYLQNISNELAGSMPMELTWSLKENIQFAMSFLTLHRFLGGHLIVTSYYLLLLLFTFNFVKLPLYFKLSTLVPLSLSFLACDSTRFVASSSICCFLMILISAKEKLLYTPEKLRFLIYILSISFFICGPWGISPSDPLPLLKYY